MSENPQTHDFPTGLSRPAQRALSHAGYTQLAQLTAVSAAEIAKLHGMGPKGIRILQEELQARGLSFAPDAPKRNTRSKSKKDTP